MIKVVAVAAKNDKLQELCGQIERYLSVCSVNSVTDPMAAVKHLYSHESDILITEAELKYMMGTQFISMVRKRHPSMYIVVVGDSYALEKLLLSAGADMLTKEAMLGPFIQEISRELQLSSQCKCENNQVIPK